MFQSFSRYIFFSFFDYRIIFESFQCFVMNFLNYFGLDGNGNLSVKNMTEIYRNTQLITDYNTITVIQIGLLTISKRKTNK